MVAKKSTLLSLFHLKWVHGITLSREAPPTLVSASKYVYRATKKNPNKKYYFSVEKFHFENFAQKNPLVKFEFLW